MYSDLIEALLDRPSWIIDILPERVPAESRGHYFAVEQYFLEPERIRGIHLRQAELLLKLNCYFRMSVSWGYGDSWEEDPEPELFAQRLSGIPQGGFCRVIFPGQGAMIDIDSEETWMTVYDPEGCLSDKLEKLAGSEGLFMWRPAECEGVDYEC